MKTVILSGVNQGEPRSAEVCRLLVEELSAGGREVDFRDLPAIRIAACTGCFGCWVKTPGICVVDDAGRAVAKEALHCDLLVFLTPVSFGGYSSELKKAVDRLIPLLSPFFMTIRGEIHHQPRYPSYPPILGVGLLPEPDPEKGKIFRTLVERNALNYHSPFHAAEVVAPGEEERLRGAVRAALERCGKR